MKNLFWLGLLGFLLCTSSPSLAGQDEAGQTAPGDPGDPITGEITGGVIIINSGNNLNPNGSSRYLDDINSGADRKTSFIGALLPEVNYKFGEERQLGWYLNSTPPIDEAGQFALLSGLTYNRAGVGFFEAGMFYVPFTELWKNPYLTDGPRDETDVTTWGAQFAFNKIFGSNFRVRLVYLSEDVEDDDIGELFPDLKRDGQIYNISLSYDINVSKTFSLRPRFSVRQGDYDGDSSSFVKYKFDLSGRYGTGRLFFMPRVFYSYKQHDEVDPIFNTTRKQHGFGIGGAVNYAQLFGNPSLALRGFGGYSMGEATEDFYDTESFFIGAGLVYLF